MMYAKWVHADLISFQPIVTIYFIISICNDV